MTPGFKASLRRLEGQWWNLFQRIHRIRRLAAIGYIAVIQSRLRSPEQKMTSVGEAAPTVAPTIVPIVSHSSVWNTSSVNGIDRT